MLKTCPHNYWHTYVLKDLPFRESPEMKWGNRVHEALEYRLRDGKKLPADLEQHEGFAMALDRFKPKVELKLGCRRDGTSCDFFAKDVFLRGKVDVLIHDGTKAALFDWKTGKPFEDPFELRVQALLAKINAPVLDTITGQYIWLKLGELGREHDVSDTAATWAEVMALDQRALQYDRDPREPNGVWPKNPNVLCGCCAVHKCEHNPERDVKDDTGRTSQAASQQISQRTQHLLFHADPDRAGQHHSRLSVLLERALCRHRVQGRQE
jgi:hypothetical protein